jgi:hypothetical protein
VYPGSDNETFSKVHPSSAVESCSPFPVGENTHRLRPHPSNREVDALKIIIVSTPKTGNTWVKHLLAEVYGLALRELPLDSAKIDWSEGDGRWIGHQHYLPDANFLAKARSRGVIFVTTIRHPADVFVSLLHHVRRDGSRSEKSNEAGYALGDTEFYGPRTLKYLQSGFCECLHLSIAWMRSGQTHEVRYEDLWNDPVKTLSALTDQIQSVSLSRVRAAICACELESLRRKHQSRQAFFRKGGSGGWQRGLPMSFQQAILTADMLPEQIATLGYTMRPDGPENRPRPQAGRIRHPFRTGSTFENEVLIAPILIQAFFDAPEPISRRWPEDLAVGPGTFYHWVNSPATTESATPQRGFIITRLAAYLYSIRPDLQKVYPDIFGSNRMGFVQWLVCHGLHGYDLEDAFALPIFGRDAADPAQLTFPMRGTGEFENGVKIRFLHSVAFYRLPPSVTQRWPNPLATGRNSFFAWLNQPAQKDAPVTKLAWLVYSIRPDVQNVFKSIFGTDSRGFLEWFKQAGTHDYGLDETFLRDPT